VSDENRRRHPVADALGAVLRGAREGDALVRKRARGFATWLAGGGFAVYAALRLLAIVEGQIEHQDQDRAALVAELRETRRSLDDLIWSLWETNETQEQRVVALLRALKVAVPPPVKRPEKPRPVEAVDEGGGG
jgi:hypothetical protein